VVAALLAAGTLFDWSAGLDPRPGLPRATAQPAKGDSTKTVAELVDQDEGRLVKVFKHLHANPELGYQEVKTTELVAREFNELGYEVNTGRPSGHGSGDPTPSRPPRGGFSGRATGNNLCA
jgi:hypothetical protein